MGNRTAVQDAISDRVNQLYGLDVFGPGPSPPPSGGSGRVPSQPSSPDHDVWDWTVRIEFKMHELRSSFFVFIFLGEVPANPRDWHTSPNYVGSACAFVNSAAQSCSNCIGQREAVLEQFVHLNHGIFRNAELASLKPNDIKPYLTKALQWKAQKVLVYLFIYIFQYMFIIHFLSINPVKRRTGGTSVS